MKLSIVQNAGELVVLPAAVVTAHQETHKCIEVATIRRRSFVRSLFTGGQQDEVNERLRGLARAIDALASYIVHRDSYSQSLNAAFATKMALKREETENLLSYGKAGFLKLEKIPDNAALYASIDDGVEKMAQLDASALGLIETFNDRVRSLRHYCSQHMFAIPWNHPLPKEITLD